VIRTLRTRSARDISAVWLVVALFSMSLWIAYGSLSGAQTILWANAFTGVQAGFILAVKRWSERKPDPTANLEPVPEICTGR
jgi:uncharacterized protein with PQ loop repeat